jgi:glycosyltransferase involved in cell wall biosynthesis
MTLPVISIVTPSFNQAAFLEETIDSVLSQNYSRLEYVVIDGGSTDGSADIIERHAKRLHYWVSEQDAGHAAALNKGFARTSGEIMAWINSDDKYLPWTFEVVAEIFAEFPQINWISGFPSGWSSRGFLTDAQRLPKNIYDYLLGNYQWIQQESVFWRRSLWDKAGATINADYRLMVDGELWTRFFLHDELYSVDCILGGYRKHATNRAKDHRAECLLEMERAIAAMRQRCSPAVLRTVAQLKPLQGLKATPGLSYLPITGMGRALMPSAFAAAAYKNLVFENERWKQRELSFAV